MKHHNEKIQKLIEIVSEKINGILRANIYELSMKEDELKALKEKKSELRMALKNCGIGDYGAKAFVKEIIKDILSMDLISPENINEYINFDNPNELSSRDKFDILLYEYIKENGSFAIEKIFKDFDWLKKTGDNQINEEDIFGAYLSSYIRLDF